MQPLFSAIYKNQEIFLLLFVDIRGCIQLLHISASTSIFGTKPSWKNFFVKFSLTYYYIRTQGTINIGKRVHISFFWYTLHLTWCFSFILLTWTKHKTFLCCRCWTPLLYIIGSILRLKMYQLIFKFFLLLSVIISYNNFWKRENYLSNPHTANPRMTRSF